MWPSGEPNLPQKGPKGPPWGPMGPQGAHGALGALGPKGLLVFCFLRRGYMQPYEVQSALHEYSYSGS